MATEDKGKGWSELDEIAAREGFALRRAPRPLRTSSIRREVVRLSKAQGNTSVVRPVKPSGQVAQGDG